MWQWHPEAHDEVQEAVAFPSFFRCPDSLKFFLGTGPTCFQGQTHFPKALCFRRNASSGRWGFFLLKHFSRENLTRPDPDLALAQEIGQPHLQVRQTLLSLKTYGPPTCWPDCFRRTRTPPTSTESARAST